jgi:NOL1/NOP2/fmu family ribosome biogenesis protein
LCAQRQRRILADALPALKENGLLIYSTCSYSMDEDEAIGDWLVQDMGMMNEQLHLEDVWNIIETTSPETGSKGYRFYPDKVKGEGFFISCFRKGTEGGSTKLRPVKVEPVTAMEKNILSPWLKNKNFSLLKSGSDFHFFQERFFNDFTDLKSVLNIIYFGIRAGQIMKNKLVPDHAFALSRLLDEDVPSIELDYFNAIKYLQRQDMAVKPETTGWQTVRFKGHNLGWINALPNRINNYYPKELRILKQSI